MLKSYLILAFAIACEVIATTALVRSEGFTKLVPTLIMALGYGIAFYCLSIVSNSIPIGIALIILGLIVINLFSKSVSH